MRRSTLLLLVLLVSGFTAAPTAESPPRAPLAAGPEPTAAADTADPEVFRPVDVFGLEWAADPRVSPDGRRVVYVRGSMDIMRDRRRSELWTLDVDGGDHRPLVADEHGASSPRWSPSGDRLLYTSSREDDGTELFLRWMDTGQTARLTQLERSPSGMTWSPDGEWIAFTMFVPEERESFAEMPRKPEGAEWADPARVVRDAVYRRDGAGRVDPGHRQVFVLRATGGTARQLTTAPRDHGAPAWTPGSESLVTSAGVEEDPELRPLDSDLREVPLDGGEPRRLTDRYGPDANPAVSPDGRWIAYTGFDDRHQGYQVSDLYILDRESGDTRRLTADFDRSVGDPVWSGDGERIWFSYTDEGVGRIAYATLDGEVRDVAASVGGGLGRPYSGGSFTISPGGRFAFTLSAPDHPADVAVGTEGEGVRRLTRLNDDLLAHRELGRVEEIRYASSHDGREIQGWVILPPDFDPSETYPLLLEIHGGPFAAYGPHFTAELQLYAAAGYVVLYTNPRGSTSYGEEFGNLIHHAYPGHDFDDLISGVDAVIDRGWADPDRLFVTGGSGGGVLSAWIVGRTDRFRAAAVQKPVINWYSWALTADMYPYGVKYWFPGPPWEHEEHYMERSPISLVGEVTTPTMLITGEEDYRTPMSETRQFYQALQLAQVPSMMVEIPGASHSIARRPSQLIGKVAHVLAWFEEWGG